MKIIRFICSVVPGPAVVWLTSWFDLFRNTIFSHPQWIDLAQRSSTAVAAVTCVVFALIFQQKSEEKLERYTLASLFLAFLFAVVCVGFFLLLSNPLERTTVELSIRIWLISFLAMLASAAVALTFAILRGIRA